MARPNRSSGLLLVMVFLLVGLAAFLGYLQYQKQKQVLEQERQLLEKEKLVLALNRQVDSVLVELNTVQASQSQLSEIVDNQKIELELQRKKIEGLIHNGNSLAAAKKEMEILRESAQTTQLRIKNLQDSLLNLRSFSQRLQKQNTVLNDSLLQSQTVNTQLVRQKDTLLSRNKTLVTTNDILDQQVSKGSALLLEILEIHGIKPKNSGQYASTLKSKKMKGIEVCFEMKENLLQSEEIETFYLRVIAPGGATLNEKEQQQITLADDLTPLLYSAAYEEPYNPSAPKCVTWETDLVFSPGDYQVEFYNKGYRVAQDEVTFR